MDTYRHMMQVDKAYALALDGRAIDQALLEETMAAYSYIPPEVERYSDTVEYQMYARPYSAIFNFVRNTTDMNMQELRQWTPEETDFYARWQTAQQAYWQRDFLTAQEQQFWLQQMARLNQPLRYGYHRAYQVLCDCLYTTGTLVLLLVTVCLSGLFPEEHLRRTDALLLCSKQGRGVQYWAKLAAGCSFAVGLALLCTVFSFGLAFLLYGTAGFDVPFQFVRPHYVYPLSVGQAVLLAYAMLILGAALLAVFVMMLSELLHSSTATLALTMGWIILTMFLNLPPQHRLLAQLWDYLPSNFIAIWGVFGDWTVPVLGRCVLDWQIVPLLYLALMVLLAVVGLYRYRRYQVQGR